MTRARDPVIVALADQQTELAGLLRRLGDGDWSRPTRCVGWTVSDVVLHLAQSDELAIASLGDRLEEAADRVAGDLDAASDADEVAALMVERERGRPHPEVRERWRRCADELVGLLETLDRDDALGRRVLWVSGSLTARTLATTRLAETWIHAHDVADATGTTLAPTARLWQIARLAWRTLPYAFARAGRELDGPVAFRLVGPAGEDWDFLPDTEARTVIRGDADELCAVAARRVDVADTALRGEGPDAARVLDLVRTYA